MVQGILPLMGLKPGLKAAGWEHDSVSMGLKYHLLAMAGFLHASLSWLLARLLNLWAAGQGVETI